MKEHLLVHVDCTYGIGHYRRVELLVRAWQGENPDRLITILAGAPLWPPFYDLPRCRVVALPGWCQSLATTAPIALDGKPIETVLGQRQRIIEATLATAEITTVLFEFFPFSSQFLVEEARALVATVRRNCPGARILSSVRDIVWNQRMQAAREQWKGTAQALIRELIDGILVHSDPAFLPFDYCWGGAPEFAAKIVHTGFLTERSQPRPAFEPTDTAVVCSVGGGKDGLPALRLFLEAWDLLRRRNALPRAVRGQVFAGHFPVTTEQDALLRKYEHLFTAPPGNLRLGSWDKYREAARRAGVSVSMSGYNTSYELLSWGVPAIFVPRDSLEQKARASLIQERGWAQVAGDQQQLADALLRAWASEPQRRLVPPLDFEGAARTARLIAS